MAFEPPEDWEPEEEEPFTNPPGYTDFTSGLASTFGYNDPEDTGVGAWGDVTNDPNAYGVSLSEEELRQRFGDPDAARGALVEVTGPNGNTVVAPIVDKGPAPWVTERQGPTIDVTEGVRRDLGGTGLDPVNYRIIGHPPGDWELERQPSGAGQAGGMPPPPDWEVELTNVQDAIDPDAPYMSKPRDPSGIKRIIMHGNVGMDFDKLVQYGRQVDPDRGFAPGYHFYIAKDGTIKQGAPVDRITNHTLGENGDSIGIVIDGADNGQMPTPAQEASAKQLIGQLGLQYKIDPQNVVGHGELQPNRREALEGGTIARDVREQGYFWGGGAQQNMPTPKNLGPDWEVETPAPAAETPAPPEGVAPETSEERVARAQTNRARLSNAIEQLEKQGYAVPHFIGTPNEPEGDRGPTMDMENLVTGLKKLQKDEEAAGNKIGAEEAANEVAYWERKIKTEGMSAEQWKAQTGEEEPGQKIPAAPVPELAQTRPAEPIHGGTPAPTPLQGRAPSYPPFTPENIRQGIPVHGYTPSPTPIQGVLRAPLEPPLARFAREGWVKAEDLINDTTGAVAKKYQQFIKPLEDPYVAMGDNAKAQKQAEKDLPGLRDQLRTNQEILTTYTGANMQDSKPMLEALGKRDQLQRQLHYAELASKGNFPAPPQPSTLGKPEKTWQDNLSSGVQGALPTEQGQLASHASGVLANWMNQFAAARLEFMGKEGSGFDEKKADTFAFDQAMARTGWTELRDVAQQMGLRDEKQLKDVFRSLPRNIMEADSATAGKWFIDALRANSSTIAELGPGTGGITPGGQSALDDITEKMIMDRSTPGLIDNSIRAAKRGWYAGQIATELDKTNPNLDRVAELQREIAKVPASAEFQRTWDEKVSPEESLKAFVKDPVGNITQMLVESAASQLPTSWHFIGKIPERAVAFMGAGGAAGAIGGPETAAAGAAGGLGLGAATGFAEMSMLSSKANEYASSIMQSLQESGVNINDAAALKKAFSDPKLMATVRDKAEKKAVPVGIFDGLSATIGGRIFSQPAKKLTGKALEWGTELLVQAGLGASGEAAGQLASEGKITSPKAVVAEAAGELGGGVQEVAVGRVQQAAAAPFAKAPTPAVAEARAALIAKAQQWKTQQGPAPGPVAGGAPPAEAPPTTTPTAAPTTPAAATAPTTPTATTTPAAAAPAADILTPANEARLRAAGVRQEEIDEMVDSGVYQRPTEAAPAVAPAAAKPAAKPTEIKSFAELPAGLGIPVGGTATPAPEAAAAMPPTTPAEQLEAESEAEARGLMEQYAARSGAFAGRGAPTGVAPTTAPAAPTTAAPTTMEEWAAQPQAPAAAQPTTAPIALPKQGFFSRIMGAVTGQSTEQKYADEHQRIKGLTNAEVVDELGPEYKDLFENNAITKGLGIPVEYVDAGHPMAIDAKPDGAITLQVNPRFMLAMESSTGRSKRATNRILAEELIHGAETILQKEDWQNHQKAFNAWMGNRNAPGPAPKIPGTFVRWMKEDSAARMQHIRDAIEKAPEKEKEPLYQAILDSYNAYYMEDVHGRKGTINRMQVGDAGKIFDEIANRGKTLGWAAEFVRQAKQHKDQGDISESTWVKILDAVQSLYNRIIQRLKKALPGVYEGKFGPEVQAHLERIENLLASKGVEIKGPEYKPTYQKGAQQKMGKAMEPAAPKAAEKPKAEKAKAPEKAKPKPKPESAEAEAAQRPARGAPIPTTGAPATGGPEYGKVGNLFTRRYKGMAQNLIEAGGPAANIGKAMLTHVDREAALKGELGSPLVPKGNLWSKATASREFKSYWETFKEKGRVAADALGIGPEADRLVQAARANIAKINSETARLGIKIYNTSTGGMSSVPPIGDYPEILSQDTINAIDDRHTHQKEWERLKDAMHRDGIISGATPADIEDAANNYARDVLAAYQANKGTMAKKMPAMAYDNSLAGFTRFVNNWAQRAALKEAFGTKFTIPGGTAGKNIFDLARREAMDKRTKHYIDSAEAIAYGRQSNDSFMTTAANAATAVQLANWKSTLKNLYSGLVLNPVHLGATRSTIQLFNIKGFFEAIKDGKEKGLLLQDMMNSMQDANNKGFWGKAAGLGLKAHLYGGVETVVRAQSILGARSYLRSAIDAFEKNPNSRSSRQYLGKLQRLGFGDPTGLIDEDGTGPLTDTYLRRMVNSIQGGYTYADSPAFLSSAQGRFVMQYGKWGTEQATKFESEILKPFVRMAPGTPKETVTYTDKAGNKQTVKVPGEAMPMIRMLIIMGAAGAGWEWFTEQIFGDKSKYASWSEIFTKASRGDRQAIADGVGKLFNYYTNLGAAGIIGDKIKRVFDFTSGRSSLTEVLADIPAMGMLTDALDLTQDFFDRGDYDNIPGWLRFLERAGDKVSAVRTAKQAAGRLNDVFGADFRFARKTAKLQDMSWVKSVNARADAALGVAPKPRFLGGSGATEETTVKDRIYEHVFLGETYEAKQLIKEQLKRFKDDKDKEDYMKKIKASVLAKQPLGEGAALRELRLQWAKKNLHPDEWDRLRRMDKDYRRTAEKAELLKDAEKAPKERDIDELRDSLKRAKKRREMESPFRPVSQLLRPATQPTGEGAMSILRWTGAGTGVVADWANTTYEAAFGGVTK